MRPFVGRLDDIGCEGMPIVWDMGHIFKLYVFKAEIIVASARHLLHISKSRCSGCDNSIYRN